MSRRVLVTGGAGFIGSHLVDRLLADGDQVRVLDDLSSGMRANLDARADLLVGDVVDRPTLATALRDVQAVFHLAAIASVERANQDLPGTHRVNQSGTVAVLDGARAAGRVPVVYASSAAVYGDTGEVAASEDLAPNPITAYGVDKLGSELHARVASTIHGVPTLGLRFFNVYGPRQDPSSPYSGVISIFARRLASGDRLMLHGGGRQTRDFVHVADVVAHLQAAMQRLLIDPAMSGRVLNVCTGRAVAVCDLALMLGRRRGNVPQFEHGPQRSGDIAHSRGRADSAVAALNVRSGIALEDGLASLETIEPASRA